MSDVVRWTENDKTNNNENHNNIRVSDEYNTSHSTKQDSEYSSCCRSFSKSVNNAIIDKNQTSRVINNISNSNKTSRSDSSSLDSCSVAALRVEHSWNSECILRHTKTIKTTKTKLSVKNYLVTKIMSNVKANENGGVRKRNDRSFYKSISLSYLFVILQINILLSNFIVMVCASDQLYTTGNYTNSRTSNLFGDSIGHTSNDHGHYTSSWAVHIPNGDNDNLADRVAAEHGFINMGKIFNDHYHFHHNKIAKRSLQPSHHHQKRLSNDERILWSRQQRAKSRQKRDFIRMRPTRTSQTLSFAGAIKLNDQKWPQMWYLNRGNDIDMNVIPVWKEGITGKGVVVTILDDGLESDHPDLEANYDALASYDVNSHDPNPMPRYDMQDTNRHGTRCAGEVAATANNSLCTVGIAYGAKVGGVRMLDGDVTDAVEARSLSLNPQHIDIYSASWGPDDDGKTVDGPGELATQAFIDGVTTGRGGKGSIFIWASGNGGRETDNCNCDGYTNSIWTLSISSATEGGHVPWYSEKCSSTLATTYSSGGLDEKQVITTDLHHACTSSHTGTSASAPLAAGIVALVLEANRNLTWRDLQHIVVRTAKPGNLKDPSWTRNGVGRRVSHSFGYGLMDASAMVKTAKTWKTVPEQQRCEINAPHSDKVIPPKNHITLQLNVQHCMGVNFLEHVQAKITLTSQRRGDIQIYLKSPAGTKVTLLTSRNHDISRSGFNQWPFMSVHTWGEAPHGNWQLEIHNEGRYLGHAALKGWSLIFYGTALPVDKNDPISVRVPITNETISTSSSSTQTHHQTYSSQYPIISPANRNHFPITILGKPNGKTNAALTNVGSPNVSSGSNSGINSNGGSSNNGNNNNAGSSNGNSGSGSGGGRKQQGNHQSSSHYGAAIVTSPKKNGKNSKNNNNSSGNKSNNKNSNNNNNQKSSSGTNRPNYQQLGNNQYGNINPSSGSNTKNNFYRLPSGTNGGGGGKSSSNGKQSQSVSSTQRAKLSNFGSASVSSSSTSNSGSNRSEKLGRLHEKIPIKAPKQVKDNEAFSSAAISTQPPQTSSSSLVNSNTNQRYGSYERIQTQNSRIPKLFEQYEKIQQIFPEFHPYTGPKETPQSQTQHQSSALNSETRPPPNKKQYPFYEPPGGISRKQGFNSNSNSNRGSSAASSSSTSHSSSVFTNPKPSRENSKKSQNFQSEERGNGQRGRMYIPNRKNTKAQISQWDMIFYGTSQPTQPDDPVRANPGKYGSYGGEMEHNILDIDSDAASGQWRNLQQVGEAHVDVQRTTSNDLTSKACLSYSTDQKCLECEQTTFLYNGGCYNRCPDETYMVPEYPTIPPASRYRTNSRSESLSLRRRRDEESEMGTYENLNDIIQKQRAIMHPIPQKLCASCHPTCLKCRGPNQSHCLSCGSGFNLRVVNSDESYCYPTLQGRPLKANLSREAGSLSDDVNFSLGFVKNLNMAYSIVALFVMILVVALIINAYKKQLKSCLLGGNGHDYDRVQFDCESDERKALKSMEYTSVDDDFKNDNKYDPHEPPAKIFGVRENFK